ncbi:uncharacterized protein LOC119286997 isoform X3 [Triticum dicoccoides]|uniref:uncharacterized protein LOC119286997 isoform X3 n=1 Tax=Triticum dicoccoides TaxID=85692 RepID=UPI00188EE038|nr:uncharacterized protein LOC119286997 isoform X3 [Triticum dicoccoides]XP_037422373.1 uncharacterized protein LOC119286997 isoform X3 [Triticum dicoccoides]
MFWTLAIICRRKWILLSFRRTWAFQLEKQYSGKQYAFRILILGFGAIGMEIAKRLRPFGVKILATKRNWSSNTVSCDLDGLVDKKGGPEDMYELVREADIVITCMTLNNESVGIVDHKFLSALKKVVGDVALKLHAGEPFTEIEFVN